METDNTQSAFRQFSHRVGSSIPTLLVYAIVVGLVLIAVVLSPTFREPRNIFNILRQAIPLSLVAIGQTVVVLTGGIDFSVGATATVVALVAAVTLDGRPEMIIPVILLGVAIGVAIGLANGVIIARLQAMPFIVTFGMFGILTGIILTISSGPIGTVPPSYLELYDASIAGLPFNVIAIAMVWLGAWVLLTRLPLGRNLYAVGGSPEIARLAGITVSRTLITGYVISGLCAALAGLFLLARAGVGDPNIGAGLDFQSVTAVAVGGVSLYGGRGSIIGTLGGVLLLTVMSNVFNMTQVSVYYQQLLTGVVILLAVALYKPRRLQILTA